MVTKQRLGTVDVIETLSCEQTAAVKDAAERSLFSRAALHERFSIVDKFWMKYPEEPGVYCIFDNGTLVYVGETGELRGRMRDLRDTRNHTIRRSLGKHLFSTRPGYIPASSRKAYTTEIEAELGRYMSDRLTVCGLVVTFGRKEIEEHLIAKHKPLLCSKGQRGCKL